jgi:enolase-phosphatase E1
VSALPPAAVLTDITGTTTPASFVHDVLFPFVRTRLPAWLARTDIAEVAAAIAEARRSVPDQEPPTTLAHWLERDGRAPPLIALQSLIWQEGYREGALHSAIFADVPPALMRWARAGLRLYAYGIASAAAQRSIFANSTGGDLAALFSGFFDTRVGSKREPDSYARLAIAINLPPVEILYLSDTETDLDAAAAAGMRTCQIVRADEGTLPSDRHPVAADFAAVGAQLDLSRAA